MNSCETLDIDEVTLNSGSKRKSKTVYNSIIQVHQLYWNGRNHREINENRRNKTNI